MRHLWNSCVFSLALPCMFTFFEGGDWGGGDCNSLSFAFAAALFFFVRLSDLWIKVAVWVGVAKTTQRQRLLKVFRPLSHQSRAERVMQAS